MGSGYAYVGVSAQLTGVEGGETRLEILGVPEISLTALKGWDPERYEPLAHPGDEYSYDIFTQVGQLVRTPSSPDPLDGLEPTYVLAAGESQSAGRMITYVNAVHPLVDVFDGFLIHGCSKRCRGVGA